MKSKSSKRKSGIKVSRRKLSRQKSSNCRQHRHADQGWYVSYTETFPGVAIHVILNYTTEVLANQTGGTTLDDGTVSTLLFAYHKVLIDVVGVMMSTVPPPTLREVLNHLADHEDTWFVRIQFEPHPHSSMQKMWDTVKCRQEVPEELFLGISSMIDPEEAIFNWTSETWPTAMIRKRLKLVFFHDFKNHRSFHPYFVSWCPLSQFIQQQHDEFFCRNW